MPVRKGLVSNATKLRNIKVLEPADKVLVQGLDNSIKFYKKHLERLKSRMSKLYEKYAVDGRLSFDDMNKFSRLKTYFKQVAKDTKEIRRILGIDLADNLKKAYNISFKSMISELQKNSEKLLKFEPDPAIRKAVLNRPTGGLGFPSRMARRGAKTLETTQATFLRLVSRPNGATFKEMAFELTNALQKDLGSFVSDIRVDGNRMINSAKRTAFDFSIKIDAGLSNDLIWVHDSPDIPREGHVAMDGQRLGEIEEGLFVNPLTGAVAEYAGGFGDPAEDMNCLCRLGVAEKEKKGKV